MSVTWRLAFQRISQQVWLANCPTPSNALCCVRCVRSFRLIRSSRSRAASWGGTRYTSLPWIFPRTVYCMLVRHRSEFLFFWACFSPEISSAFVIADVRPKIVISSFFQILRVDRRIWETTRVFSLMSVRELWHLHARVTSCCFLLSLHMNCLCLFLWWAVWPFLGEASLNQICGEGIVLRWGSWGCRKFVSILDPLKGPSQASFGTFFFRDWNKLKGDSWIYRLDSGNRINFQTTFPDSYFCKWVQELDFKFCFTWYLIDIIVDIWSGFIPHWNITCVEKRYTVSFPRRRVRNLGCSSISDYCRKRLLS